MARAHIETVSKMGMYSKRKGKLGKNGGGNRNALTGSRTGEEEEEEERIGI